MRFQVLAQHLNQGIHIRREGDGLTVEPKSALVSQFNCVIANRKYRAGEGMHELKGLGQQAGAGAGVIGQNLLRLRLICGTTGVVRCSNRIREVELWRVRGGYQTAKLIFDLVGNWRDLSFKTNNDGVSFAVEHLITVVVELIHRYEAARVCHECCDEGVQARGELNSVTCESERALARHCDRAARGGPLGHRVHHFECRENELGTSGSVIGQDALGLRCISRAEGHIWCSSRVREEHARVVRCREDTALIVQYLVRNRCDVSLNPNDNAVSFAVENFFPILIELINFVVQRGVCD